MGEVIDFYNKKSKRPIFYVQVSKPMTSTDLMINKVDECRKMISEIYRDSLLSYDHILKEILEIKNRLYELEKKSTIDLEK